MITDTESKGINGYIFFIKVILRTYYTLTSHFYLENATLTSISYYNFFTA